MDFRVSRDIRPTLMRVAVAACIVVPVIAPAQLAGATPYNETVPYSFQGGVDGADPLAGLIFDSSGALYGTTWGGSAFKLTPPAAGQTQWTETVLYSFKGGADGDYPAAGLIFDTYGALYGTTAAGGSANLGTVFKLTPPAAGQTQWTEAVLYSFKGGRAGVGPQGGLIFDTHGALYGTTVRGGGTYTAAWRSS